MADSSSYTGGWRKTTSQESGGRTATYPRPNTEWPGLTWCYIGPDAVPHGREFADRGIFAPRLAATKTHDREHVLVAPMDGDALRNNICSITARMMSVHRVLVITSNALILACMISGVSLLGLILFSGYSRDRGVATFTVSHRYSSSGDALTPQFNIIDRRAVVYPVHALSANSSASAVARAGGIPKSTSFGTERICFDFEETRTCHPLAGNITALFPVAVVGAPGVRDRMDRLWTVVGRVNISSCATASLASFCTFGVLLCILPFMEAPLTFGLRAVVRGVVTLLLCIPMLVSTLALHFIREEILKAAFLTSKSGDVRYYSLGALCLSALIGLLSIGAIFFRSKSTT